VAYRILLRRDTQLNWGVNNPILLSGEPGYETDTHRFKIGNGIKPWNELGYYSGVTGSIGATGYGPTGPIGPTGPAGGPIGPTGAPSTIPGPTGPTGYGPTGATGADSTVQGPTGATGFGVSAGGATGQFLYKIDGTDYATGWTDVNVTYTNPDPVPSPGLGGIAPGSTFSNQTMTDMWTALLYPYQSPSFPTFTIYGQSQTLEVGIPIASGRTFTWSVGSTANVNIDSISISNFTDNVTIATGLSAGASPYTSSSPTVIGPSSATTKIFRIQGVNTNSDAFNKDFSVSWQWRLYYGATGSVFLDQNQIKLLSNNTLATTENRSYVFPAVAIPNYKYFCWPDVFGSPTSGTGFFSAGNSVAMATSSQDAFYSLLENGWYYGLTGVVNAQGVTAGYRVYRTFNEIGGAVTITVS
jgi:hypothetical protein